MNRCIRCKKEKQDEELNKHSTYNGTQRFICKPCNAERVASRRFKHLYPQKGTFVSTIQIDDVSTENEPVSKPIVATSVDTKEEILAKLRSHVDTIMNKQDVPTEVEEVDEEFELIDKSYG